MLVDLGVDGIISDLPTTLCAVLSNRGASPGRLRRLVASARLVPQPRPVLGRFPWLAFFFDRSLRLLVFLDMAAQAIGHRAGASE